MSGSGSELNRMPLHSIEHWTHTQDLLWTIEVDRCRDQDQGCPAG